MYHKNTNSPLLVSWLQIYNYLHENQVLQDLAKIEENNTLVHVWEFISVREELFIFHKNSGSYVMLKNISLKNRTKIRHSPQRFTTNDVLLTKQNAFNTLLTDHNTFKKAVDRS